MQRKPLNASEITLQSESRFFYLSQFMPSADILSLTSTNKTLAKFSVFGYMKDDKGSRIELDPNEIIGNIRRCILELKYRNFLLYRKIFEEKKPENSSVKYIDIYPDAKQLAKPLLSECEMTILADKKQEFLQSLSIKKIKTSIRQEQKQIEREHEKELTQFRLKCASASAAIGTVSGAATGVVVVPTAGAVGMVGCVCGMCATCVGGLCVWGCSCDHANNALNCIGNAMDWQLKIGTTSCDFCWNVSCCQKPAICAWASSMGGLVGGIVGGLVGYFCCDEEDCLFETPHKEKSEFIDTLSKLGKLFSQLEAAMHFKQLEETSVLQLILKEKVEIHSTFAI